jgi:Arc/MetJ-type ribon-helix-helix transcriptional regulator
VSKTEKVTINMSVVDLGKVDLLVAEGFYSNRTDFIRAAIRSQLGRHDVELRQAVTRNTLAMGLIHCGRQDLERAVAGGERLAFKVVGMLVLGADVTPELALAAIDSVKVYGVFHAPQAVKEVLDERIH